MNNNEMNIIPANPGWYVVTPCWNGDEPTPIYDEVIGWVMANDDQNGKADMKPEPVTVDGVQSNEALYSPQGRYIWPGWGSSNEDQLVEEFKQREGVA